MTVSIYLLGYVVSPVFIAPLSEIYGRRLILTVANVFFCVWQIGCALAPNIAALIVARFFSGLGGAACLVCKDCAMWPSRLADLSTRRWAEASWETCFAPSNEVLPLAYGILGHCLV